MTSKPKGLLERLADGPVVGDGSMLWTLEKRGYVAAGSWTPEAVVQYPDAVKQLHREFLRAGADVLQTFTFFASEENLKFKGVGDTGDAAVSYDELNRRACELAREVADEGDALVAGSLSPVTIYQDGAGKERVQEAFKKQLDIFQERGVDFLLGEFFGYVEEAEWAVEVMVSSGLPVACMMKMTVIGDTSGVKPDEVAVRLAKAGADVIGVNCCFDPRTALETIAVMKEGLERAGLKKHLMVQPVGYHTQEIKYDPIGYSNLPEFPFAMEPRALTRIDARQFARRAYELGVTYIGGCCGFEPYHIRAIAEELTEERGRPIPGADKSYPDYSGLKKCFYESQRARGNQEYWNKLVPAVGRKEIQIMADINQNH
ncbi:betaine--homocysteine S-methyltransferase 1-like [Diadema setosum]|uniref:betaine--homocysteine S-methyltransferase 1-like n=1 Tax=Diadema setosum TaxID=31175 RepID=UPI003B3B8A06